MVANRTRKSKKQPRLRPAQKDLAQVLSHYDVDALWAVLQAAGASPTARGRWTTVLHLTAAAIAAPSHRSQPASAKTFPKLLREVARTEPGLAQREDFISEDPRGVVRVRVGNQLRRLFPGNIERPIADVDRDLVLADLLDAPVSAAHGFTITDVIEVVTGHVDRMVTRFASAWPTGELDLDHPTLTDAEIAAVFEDVDTPDSDEQRRALDWLTRPAADVQYSLGDPMSLFGTTARVILSGEANPRWLPLCALPEVLNQAVAELAAEVADDPAVEHRFVQSVADRVRRRLWRFSPVVLGPPDVDGLPQVSRENVAQWAVPFGRDRLVAVQVLASLSNLQPDFAVPAVVSVAKRVQRGDQLLPMVEGGIAIPGGSQVVPVVVAAAAAHLVTPTPGDALVMSLEDLDWIAGSAKQDTDLLHFGAEVVAPGQAHMVALETINSWEWWRANGGTFFRGGQQFGAMLFEQHRGAAEWERGLLWTPLEETLLRLDLPPARAWDLVDLRPDAPTQLVGWHHASGSEPAEREDVHRRPAAELLILHLGEVPVVIFGPAPSSLVGIEVDLFGDLPGAIAFGLRALESSWSEICHSAGIAAVRLRLVSSSTGVACEAGAVVRNDDRLDADLRVDAVALTTAADGDPGVGRSALAAALGQVLERSGAPSDAVDRFRQAWSDAAPTLTVTSYDRITARTSAPPPIGIEGPLEAAVERALAAAARTMPLKPGRYGPEAAQRLDRDVLAPAALRELHGHLARYEVSSVIRFGMVQIERILMQQDSLLRNLDQSAAHLDLAWDPIEQRRQTGEEHLRLRRTAELVVEVELLTLAGATGAGAAVMDERGWAESMAAGAVYLDAAGRAETLHYQLVPSGIEVSTAYELHVIPWVAEPNAPRVLHVGELEQQTARDHMRSTSPAPEDEGWKPLSDRADAAFADFAGASFTDVGITLLALAAWPLPDDGEEAVTASLAHVLEQVKHAAPDLETARAAAALQLLLSIPADYASESWRPWRLRSRRTRLLTRPIPVLPNGELIIAPHYCAVSFRVYQGYWAHGLLPWTDVSDKRLRDALDAMRSHRNRQLEDETDVVLRSDSWSTIARVKVGDGARLGVPALTTEIDIVAGRAGDDVIHLLEVKDPAPVFGPPEIRRQLEQFLDRDGNYSGKLDRKVAELAPYADKIAAKLGLPKGVRYSVQARFVTRRIIPAAFAGASHPFVQLSELIEALSPPEGDAE